MGVYRTYFTESNTIVKGFSTGSTEAISNFALNPVTELFYGAGTGTTVVNTNYSRNIFKFDLSGIQTRISDKRITLSGFSATSGIQHKAVHKLKMTNTIFNNDALLGKDTLFNSATRANSFDLVAFKMGQDWDAGVKFDTKGVSNWCFGKTNTVWSGGTYDNVGIPTCGIYDGSSGSNASNYTRYALFPYTAMTNTTATTMVATQHFIRGNEDLDMDVTTVINDMLTGTSLTPVALAAGQYQPLQNAAQEDAFTGIKNYGLGIAFNSRYEAITTDEKRYVGFFNEGTNTFFEPYIETTYMDTIIDDREKFYMGKTNRICLYVNVGSEPTNLDDLPGAVVYDSDGDVYQRFISVNTDHQNASLYTPYTSVQHVNTGIYCIDLTVPSTCACPLVQYSDVWSGMSITQNGITQNLDNVTNYITIREQSEYYNIGTDTDLPRSYGLSVSGIKSDEKIKRGDLRKVLVSARVPYTVNQTQIIDSLKYRLYIKDGTSEYTVIDYTDVNRTPTRNYFIIDTSWLIPNTYYIDLRLTSNQRVMTYDQELRFIVANQGLPDNLKSRVII
tara:strand:- start:1169 stop:2848 length:1680 start_codon:yes stop_codon:yes gene_type:complete